MTTEPPGHELSWAIRDLTANLLRIVAGGGRPHDVGRQCVALLAAAEAGQDVSSAAAALRAAADVARRRRRPSGQLPELEGRNISKIARALGISRQAIAGWRRVPAEWVLKLSETTGIPAWRLRPDLYEPPAEATDAAARDGQFETSTATELIIRKTLRVVAARLEGQRGQGAAGGGLFDDEPPEPG